MREFTVVSVQVQSVDIRVFVLGYNMLLVSRVTSSGKCILSIWHPSVRLSVFHVFFFLTLIGHAAQIQHDSPGGSTRRSLCTFPSEY